MAGYLDPRNRLIYLHPSLSLSMTGAAMSKRLLDSDADANPVIAITC